MSNLKLETSAFIVSEKQMALDISMVPFDVWGTKVHVLMLLKQNIIDQNAAKRCLEALLEIEKEVKTGKFAINPEKGAQLTLEDKIIEKAGEAGYGVHTGRSRNDQVMVTEMLYLREEVLGLAQTLSSAAQELVRLATRHLKTIMPGYTHMQAGKITTLGQWALSYANSLLRSFATLQYFYQLYNVNPLGACESYGTSWPLDRAYTGKLLGFNGVWELPPDVISSRGMPQLAYLTACQEASLVASKIAQDLLLMTTFEYGMIELGKEVAQRMHPITGSSVMAQKKNPDVLELVRATAPQIIGIVNIVGQVLAKLPSGYNRDSREVKEYASLGLLKTKSALDNLRVVLGSMHPNRRRMRELVFSSYLLTTDLADKIAQDSRIGYRIIYKIVGKVVNQAIAQNKPIREITASEITSCAKSMGVNLNLSDPQLKEVLDIERIIEARRNIGGSSKTAMQSAISNTTNTLRHARSWINKSLRRITAARQLTGNEIAKVL